MNKVTLAARYISGLIFFVFGLNGFLNFIPQPPLPEKALSFIMALVNTGYLMFLVKAIEVLVGLALLSGFYVRLATVVIAPITINIFLFHAFLAPEGLAAPVVLLIANVLIAYSQKDVFAPILKAKA
jgi:uncharacterized membrane protein YphA (DoxX/SURF4 family)